MKLTFDDETIARTPLATAGAVVFCPDPNCQRPHILLLDDTLKPIAQYIISPEFFRELTDAMRRRGQ